MPAFVGLYGIHTEDQLIPGNMGRELLGVYYSNAGLLSPVRTQTRLWWSQEEHGLSWMAASTHGVTVFEICNVGLPSSDSIEAGGSV